MKNLVWVLGFVVGVLVAFGCDESAQEEGVMFECGEDMCLSSEEFCAVGEDCTGENPAVFTCAPLEGTDMQTVCNGDESQGIYCSNACG